MAELAEEHLVFETNNQHEDAFWTTKSAVLRALPFVDQRYLDYFGDVMLIFPKARMLLHLELERRPERFDLWRTAF